MSHIGWDGSRGLQFTFNGIAFLGVVAGCFCLYLGYKLFTIPTPAGSGTLTANIAKGMANVGVSGPWPGVFFMAMGVIVVIVAVLSAGVGLAVAPQRGTRKSPTRRRKPSFEMLTPQAHRGSSLPLRYRLNEPPGNGGFSASTR